VEAQAPTDGPAQSGQYDAASSDPFDGPPTGWYDASFARRRRVTLDAKK